MAAHVRRCVLRQAQDEVFSLWPLADASLDVPHPELVEGRTLLMQPHINPNSSFASSLMRSLVQGGDHTSLTRASCTPGTEPTASRTWPGSAPATGQAGVVKVIST